MAGLIDGSLSTLAPSESLHISPNGNMWAFGFNQPNPISFANVSYQTSS